MGTWFPERSVNLYSMSVRENNGTLCYLGVSPLKYSALFALRQSHVDLMTFQKID